MSTIQQFNNFETDISQSILWQYNDATNLLSLINQKQDWYDIDFSGFWIFWFATVFDLRFVNIFGAAIWSIILNVPLLVSDLPYIAQPTFGFNAFLITGLTDTSLLSVGMEISGTGITPGTVIVAIRDATTIEVSALLTSTGTETLTFSLVQSCDTTISDPTLTVEDSSVLSVGMAVSGTGIPALTTILAIVDPTTITLSDDATVTGTDDITFSLDQNGDLDAPGLENEYENFENGNFSQFNQNLILSIEQQRWLLRLRYFQLSTLTNVADINASIPQSINDFLNYLCTDNDIDYTGTIYVIDNLDMTITYHFTSTGFPVGLFNILVLYDVFPRPAGVSINFTGLT